jgi:hypothetical protein
MLREPFAEGIYPVSEGLEGEAVQLKVTTAGGPGKGIRVTALLAALEHTAWLRTVLARLGLGRTTTL